MSARLPPRPPRRAPAWRRLAPCAALLAGLPVALSACQSYETGIEVICQANVRCVECQEAPPELRSMKYAEYMERLVRNGEAKTFLESIAAMDPQARIDALRREAKNANLAECPLADYFEQAMVAAPPTGGPAPVPPPAEPADTDGDTDTDGDGDTDTGAVDTDGAPGTDTGEADTAGDERGDDGGDTEEAPAE